MTQADVKRAVATAFMASDAASNKTGVLVPVDGGNTAP